MDLSKQKLFFEIVLQEGLIVVNGDQDLFGYEPHNDVSISMSGFLSLDIDNPYYVINYFRFINDKEYLQINVCHRPRSISGFRNTNDFIYSLDKIIYSDLISEYLRKKIIFNLDLFTETKV